MHREPLNRVLIIIPAYNEVENIGSVLSDVKKNIPYAGIVVVDDGSTDNTGEVARGLGATVVEHPFNMGIGAAVQTGYKFANLLGYDIAVQVDADGQHPADQIDRLIQPVRLGEADVVLGSRFLGEGDYIPSLARSIGIRLFSMLLSFITREKVTDPTSGFRAANREVIRFFVKSYPEDYPEVEAIVLLSKAGFKVKEVPARMEARVWGRSSITYIHAAYYMVKVMLAVFIDLLKKIER